MPTTTPISYLEIKRTQRAEDAIFRLEFKPSTDSAGMDLRSLPSDIQMAKDHLGCNHYTMPTQPAAFPDAVQACPAADRTAEDENTSAAYERATAQYKRMRAEACQASFERKYQRHYEAGFVAQRQLVSHIGRSLSAQTQASQTIPARVWLSIHRIAASVAQRQALRSARRLGVKRVSDTQDFFAEHCSWYVSFCEVGRRLFPGATENV